MADAAPMRGSLWTRSMNGWGPSGRPVVRSHGGPRGRFASPQGSRLDGGRLVARPVLCPAWAPFPLTLRMRLFFLPEWPAEAACSFDARGSRAILPVSAQQFLRRLGLALGGFVGRCRAGPSAYGGQA